MNFNKLKSKKFIFDFIGENEIKCPICSPIHDFNQFLNCLKRFEFPKKVFEKIEDKKEWLMTGKNFGVKDISKCLLLASIKPELEYISFYGQTFYNGQSIVEDIHNFLQKHASLIGIDLYCPNFPNVWKVEILSKDFIQKQNLKFIIFERNEIRIEEVIQLANQFSIELNNYKSKL